MTAPASNIPFNLEQTLQAEHSRLVRLCAQISGNVQAADELAQETLIEAWRNAHKLVDPDGVTYWLSAIARNVCRRWARHQGRLDARQATFPSTEEAFVAGPDSFDLAWELERDDLAHLLDRAMALLPPQTRQILIQRYLEESSLAEVAARLRLTENAVSVRLHRGRLDVLLDRSTYQIRGLF